MSPNEDNPNRPPPHHNHSSYPSSSDNDNLFVTFRNLADEAVSSMLQNLIGLPSAFTAPDPHERWLSQEARRRRTMESWGAHTSQEEEGSSRNENSMSSSAAAVAAAVGNSSTTPPPTASRQSANESSDPTLFSSLGSTDFAPSSLPPAFFDSPISLFALPFLSAAAFSSASSFPSLFDAEDTEDEAALPMARWLDLYTLHSPYSPIYLEHDPILGRHSKYRTVWRRAFEDLLDAQGGKPLRSRAEVERLLEGGDAEHGLSWRQGLGARVGGSKCECGAGSGSERMVGWKGEEEPYDNGSGMARPDDHQRQQQQQNRDQTELDMYEQVLGKDFAKERDAAQRADGARTEPGQTSQLGIVSTLTTTERVVMPDGSTNTKVILKKRFADGREESSETVHSTQGTNGSQQASGGNSNNSNGSSSMLDWAGEKRYALEQSEKNQNAAAEKKKGWFWS